MVVNLEKKYKFSFRVGVVAVDISSLTISGIRKLLEQEEGPTRELLSAMARDQRSSVRSMYRRYLAARQKQDELGRRRESMWAYESGIKEPGHHLVAGVDEAGRGPLAGPVVAAAVILPAGFSPQGLDDSKKLSPGVRATLAAGIKKNSLDWAVGVATVDEIERYNIHHASLLAMLRAVENLTLQPDLLLLDGRFTLPGLEVDQKAVVGGDGLCPSIAAASVVAKVTRDGLMDILHILYPEYGFDRHKGYGTAFHLAALSVFGPCPVHRRGFTPVRQLIDGRCSSGAGSGKGKP